MTKTLANMDKVLNLQWAINQRGLTAAVQYSTVLYVEDMSGLNDGTVYDILTVLASGWRRTQVDSVVGDDACVCPLTWLSPGYHLFA